MTTEIDTDIDAGYWIEKLKLIEHPEGGWYVRTYRSPLRVDTERLPAPFSGAGSRVLSSAIYYLLESPRYSAFHRIKSDEMWHFYAGSALTLYVIDETGGLSLLQLGRNPEKGEAFQRMVKAGCWFGALVNELDSYTLAGCTVTPGFEYEDFEMADRKALLERYPQHRWIIEKLTPRHNPT